MKKLVVLIISMFLFMPSVNALQINNVEINIALDQEGKATVTEKWIIQKQRDERIVKRTFMIPKEVKIKNLKITDLKNSKYKAVNKINKEEDFIYTLEENDNKKELLFTILSENNTYEITYQVEGMVKKFTDSLGYDWSIIGKTKGQEINTFNVYIQGPVPLEETNTALYLMGENIAIEFDKGKIHLFGNNVDESSSVRLLMLFSDIGFTKPLNVNQTFNEYYDDALNYNEFLDEINDIFSNAFVFVTVILFILFLIGLVVYKIVSKYKNQDSYQGIVTENGLTLDKLEDIKYYDTIPCDGDLYKISFLAGYFGIVKNRSNLIGAIILKWIYEGNIKLGGDKGRPYFKLLQSQRFTRKLDSDLYDMLSASSSHNIIEGNKLNRYASDHYLRMVTWFNTGHNETLYDEYTKGNVKKINQLGNIKIVLSTKLVEEANKIQGLKRYLLNFNQVPRQTELTEEGYKYILVAAELLGIGHDVAKEILRKNPDNIMAKQLLELEQARILFKSVYDTALTPYKQAVRDKNLNLAYDPNFDKLIQQKNEREEIAMRRRF